jgi:hypothetical protein
MNSFPALLLLEYSMPREFQEGNSDGVAIEWTSLVQGVDAKLCQRQP